MDVSPKDLTGLFRQLGLPDGTDAIGAFIASHGMPADSGYVWEAPFWSPAQAAFLKESWEEDSDWVEAIDELAALLHRR